MGYVRRILNADRWMLQGREVEVMGCAIFVTHSEFRYEPYVWMLYQSARLRQTMSNKNRECCGL
jgi:hypothetical protein